jgi:diguanylate cyclase (GGDEF)-like protein
MLLAPQIVKYRPANDKKEAGHLKQEETTDSFTIQITGNSGLLGYLEIIKVNQPQFLDQYKKLADRVINICALAIENAHHYQLIKDLSDTDDLTRLANRRRLDEQLREEWRRMQRNEKPLTVMMFDIDFFKHFNDRYGHQAGDDCLKAVAAVLANYCRRSGDLAARFGGEEFVLILPEVKETNAVIIAENIRKEIEGLKIAHDDSAVSKYVTMSIGVVSQVPTTEMPAEKMIAAADKALYKAKETGRNRVVIAD